MDGRSSWERHDEWLLAGTQMIPGTSDTYDGRWDTLQACILKEFQLGS